MSGERNFQTHQAIAVAEAFAAAGVEYLFLGRSAAIILGYPGITQDVDLFVEKSKDNGRKIVAALEALDFPLDETLRADIIQGKDFVQIKTGPFDLDLVFAPDGISSFAAARGRRIVHEGLPVVSIDDLIASKRASAREKDLIELPLLERFRIEYERLHPRPLKSAWEIERQKPL